MHLTWTEKQGRDLHRLDGLECIRSFSEMQAEPAMQAACAVLSEITEAFSHEGEADLKSFRLLGAVLEALEQDVPLWTAVHYFEYWTLKLHGLLPDHRSCAVCGSALTSRRSWIAPASGVCCDGCRPAGAVPGLLPQEREFLRQVATRPPTELAATGSAGGALDSLLRGTLESFAERTFRSYRHLRSATTVWRGVAGLIAWLSGRIPTESKDNDRPPMITPQ